MSLELIEQIFEQAPQTPMTGDEVERALAWAETCLDRESLLEGFRRLAGELSRRITKEALVLKYFRESEDECRRLQTLVNRFARKDG